MTETEIKLILQELHGAGLANEPKDPTSTIRVWRDFYGVYDFRVVGKAVWIHLRNSHFWPAPADLLKYMNKAAWLVELEDENIIKQKSNALGGTRTHTNLINKQSSNHKTQPPRAPAIQIEEKRCELHSGSCVMMFSDICDGPQDGKCPYEGL